MAENNRDETTRAELTVLADLSRPLVYGPSRGGGDQTEHRGNFRTHEGPLYDAREAFPEANLDREDLTLVQNRKSEHQKIRIPTILAAESASSRYAEPWSMLSTRPKVVQIGQSGSALGGWG